MDCANVDDKICVAATSEALLFSTATDPQVVDFDVAREEEVLNLLHR